MKNFKTIVVALDLTSMDETLMTFARYFDSHIAAKFYFVHVIPTFVFPGNVADLVHGITSPGYRLDALVEAKISKMISGVFGEKPGGSFEIVVEEGHPLKTLAGLTQQVDADLLLVGKKQVSEGSGIVSKMIARQVKNAVCFVTENAVMYLSDVVVPMDFSQFSVQALKQVVQMTESLPNSNIHVLHVLDYPPTTQYLTRNYGLLAPDWEQRIREAFDKCLKQNDIPERRIQFTSIKNEYFNTAEHIREFAARVNASLIVLGAKGHSSFDDLFLGSVAEKLVTIEDKIPVLIVR
jgi:nucleotide-binding universal stress UspA family protein